MMRGEFICSAGVIKNNITSLGAKQILEHAIRGVSNVPMYMGLCNAVYTNDLDLMDIDEPDFSNGYQRQIINSSTLDWPVIDTLNGEWYVESKAVVFTSTGNYSSPITRPFITFSPNASIGPVFSLAGALPASRLITPATSADDRTFKYRIYLR